MEDTNKWSAQPPSRLPDRRLLDLLTVLEPLDRYLHEVKRITASEPVDVQEKMRLIRRTGGALLEEMEGCFRTLTMQTDERKRDLQDIVTPPAPDLLAQLQKHRAEVVAVMEKLVLRDRLVRRWEKASAEEICPAYEERLAAGDLTAVELFESHAEAILARKGNEAALAAFRERRERARESRLTPDQLTARQELEELQKFENSIVLMRTGLLSLLRLYGVNQ